MQAYGVDSVSLKQMYLSTAPLHKQISFFFAVEMSAKQELTLHVARLISWLA